ncbi:MAG: FHA domain-containing protein [Verrucomicrobiae bacterium]|nr:FHA domain-containing protein [Verrucomicrobiae bacterium]
MGAVFIVTKNKKQVAKAGVTGDVFIIGRSKDCNLPVDESLASRHHVEVKLEKGAYWVRDCGSRNGTLLNGAKLLEPQALKDGDELEIGLTQLKFIWDQDRGGGGGGTDEDRTRAASFADDGKKAAGKEVVAKKKPGGLLVKLRVVDGPLQGGTFRDWEGPLNIGRGLENHVVLLDDAVSIAHARIVHEDGAYFIEDLQSSNGTFLDGVKVQKTLLTDGKKIKVGISTLVFELVDPQKQRRQLKIALITISVIAVLALAVKFLQPPDVAGQHIALAQDYFSRDDMAKAADEYAAALKIDPNRVEAKRGLQLAKDEMEADELLKQAEQEATAENYDKAKELCYRVLRSFPQKPQAVELAAVIKSIENAKLAFASRNWADAKHLLDKVHETYPQSKLIRLRLDEAQNELVAEGNLAKAKDDLSHQQFELAQPVLQSIPANSVYYTEAKELLDQIANRLVVNDYLNKAQASYRDGNIADALQSLDDGLKQSPGNALLLDFQKHVRQMAALTKPLETAELASQPKDVNTVLQDQATCQKIISLEDDPLNAFRKRAQAAQANIADRLTQIAQEYAAKAVTLLQAGNRKEALQAFDLALKANAGDQAVIDQRNSLFQKIMADCKDLYQKGIVHQDLQQTALARAAFQEILKIGVPGEDYYERATRKLKALAP